MSGIFHFTCSEMPSKKEAVEPALLSLISAHLEENELPKTVKKLKSEHEDEV